MATRLLYEPRSPRGDHGKLIINNLLPVSIPFYFEYYDYDEDSNKVFHEIKSTDIIKGAIKEHITFNQSILEFSYTGVTNNTILLEISASDVQKLRAGNHYVLGFTLYSADMTPETILLRALPVEVEATLI